MSKIFVIACLMLGVVGCANQPIPKNPPLIPYAQKNWVVVNADDFVPPKAKTYVKVEEIDLNTVATEEPVQVHQEEQ